MLARWQSPSEVFSRTTRGRLSGRLDAPMMITSAPRLYAIRLRQHSLASLRQRPVTCAIHERMLLGACVACSGSDATEAGPRAVAAPWRDGDWIATEDDLKLRLPRRTCQYSDGHTRRRSRLSVGPSHQKAGHRAIAHVVPRGGVVNARRPGLGRVEAQRRALTTPSTARESNARWCRRAIGTAFVARIPEEVAALLPSVRADLSGGLSGETARRAQAGGRRVSS